MLNVSIRAADSHNGGFVGTVNKRSVQGCTVCVCECCPARVAYAHEVLTATLYKDSSEVPDAVWDWDG